MQAYEDRLKGLEPSVGAAAKSASTPAPVGPPQAFSQAMSRAVGGGGVGVSGGGSGMWNTTAVAPPASVWGGGGGFLGGMSAGSGSRDGLTNEERERIAKLEQERRDEEFARQLAKQEQYEASNAFYIHQAEQRKRQAGGASAGPMGGGGGGYPEQSFTFEAGPPLGGSNVGSNIQPGGGRSTIGGTQLLGGTADVDRFQQRPTLMDHLPSHLRGDEPKFDSQ